MIKRKRLLFFVVMLTSFSGATVHADSSLKDPKFTGQGTDTSDAAKLEKKLMSRSFKQTNGSKVYLPKDEVEKIKVIQTKYNDFMMPSNEKKFKKNPILNNGVYELGEFNKPVQDSLEKQLNFYRELANLEKIPLTFEDTEFAQYGAIGMASVYKQTHDLIEIEKPSDMPQEFWDNATKSTKSSNIHSGSVEKTLNYHLDSYITDYGKKNKKVGHRAGILGMQAISFGAGFAESPEKKEKLASFYTTLHTKSDFPGIKKRYSDDFVTQWPTSDYFPVQLYNKENPYFDDYYKNNKDINERSKYESNMRWSVFFNSSNYKIGDNVKVELLNNDTGEKTKVVNDENGGEVTGFNATPGYYPQGGYATIVFKPNDDFKLESNTKYTVIVDGVIKNGKPIMYEYTTYMFDVNDEYLEKYIPVDTVNIEPKKLNLAVEDTYQMNANISPNNASNKEINWSSSDPSIVEINSEGKVTAKKEGKVSITCQSREDLTKKATSEIIVNSKRSDIESIKIDKTKKNILLLGNSRKLDVEIKPSSASINDLVWESANSDVIEIDSSGVVNAKSNGIVTVTAKSKVDNRIKDTYQLVVSNKDNKEWKVMNYGDKIKDTIDYGAATEYYGCHEELTYGLLFSKGSVGRYRYTVPKTGKYTIYTKLEKSDPNKYEKEAGKYNDFFNDWGLQKNPDGTLRDFSSSYYGVNVDYYTQAKGWTQNYLGFKNDLDKIEVSLEKGDLLYYEVYAETALGGSSFFLDNDLLTYDRGIDIGTTYEIDFYLNDK